MTRRDPTKVRFLRLRLLLDDLYSLLRGWLFYMSTETAETSLDISEWHNLSDVFIKINWREELGDVNHSRIHNMSLGCQLTNRLLLRPGEVLSLRRIFRDTTAEQGFLAGPIFMHGQTGFIIGGGTCLISTLLFNAALHAGMDILEKHNHSTDLWGSDRFIDLGLDATYVYGRKDLKFRNSHRGEALFLTELCPKELMIRCRVYSPLPLPEEISVLTDIEVELHPEDRREPYRPGWIVRCKRVLGDGRVTYQKRETYRPYILPATTSS